MKKKKREGQPICGKCVCSVHLREYGKWFVFVRIYDQLNFTFRGNFMDRILFEAILESIWGIYVPQANIQPHQAVYKTTEFIKHMSAACQFGEESSIIYSCMCNIICDRLLVLWNQQIYIYCHYLHIHGIACIKSCCIIRNVLDIPSYSG